MKRALILVLLLAVVAGMGWSKTIADADGTDWMRFPPQVKGGYIIGYCSAVYAAVGSITLVYGGEVVAPMKRIQQFMAQILRIPFPHLINRLNQFYSNSENLRVPIWLALWRIEHPEFTMTPEDLVEGNVGDNG